MASTATGTNDDTRSPSFEREHLILCPGKPGQSSPDEAGEEWGFPTEAYFSSAIFYP
jgi:hypothetical protein